jgi:hypothetical protein
VLSQLSRDTWHVGWLSSVDIVVVLEKVGEHEFLFLRKVSANGHRLRGITSADINLHNIRLLRRDKDGGLVTLNLLGWLGWLE